MARIFKATCIDKATGNEMVMSEVSYNSACFWIDSHFDVTDVVSEGNTTVIYTKQGRFFFDEMRDLLMRER